MWGGRRVRDIHSGLPSLLSQYCHVRDHLHRYSHLYTPGVWCGCDCVCSDESEVTVVTSGDIAPVAYLKMTHVHLEKKNTVSVWRDDRLVIIIEDSSGSSSGIFDKPVIPPYITDYSCDSHYIRL